MSRLPIDTQCDDDDEIDLDTIHDEFEGLSNHYQTKESAEIEQSYQSQAIERQLKDNHCDVAVTSKNRPLHAHDHHNQSQNHDMHNQSK